MTQACSLGCLGIVIYFNSNSIPTVGGFGSITITSVNLDVIERSSNRITDVTMGRRGESARVDGGRSYQVSRIFLLSDTAVPER